jgi:hypothetical protein
MAYADKALIRQLSGVRPDELGFSSEGEMEEWIEANVVPLAEGAIHGYCRREWTPDSVPPLVRMIANMVGANLLQWMRANAMGPLIKADDWKLQVPQIPLLTDDIKALLAPYVALRPYRRASGYGSEEIGERWGESG